MASSDKVKPQTWICASACGAILSNRRPSVRRSGRRTKPHAEVTSGIFDKYRHNDLCAHNCFSKLTTHFEHRLFAVNLHVVSKRLATQMNVTTFVLGDRWGIRNKRRGKKMNKWRGSWPFHQGEIGTSRISSVFVAASKLVPPSIFRDAHLLSTTVRSVEQAVVSQPYVTSSVLG